MLPLSIHELHLTCPELDLTCPELHLTCPELDLTCPELDLTSRTRGFSHRKSLCDGESSWRWLASGGEGIESRRFDDRIDARAAQQAAIDVLNTSMQAVKTAWCDDFWVNAGTHCGL